MTVNVGTIAADYPLPKRKVRWLGLIFFIILHLVGIVGTPLYIYYRGITAPELALFFFYIVATGMATTMGYHRLFAHGAYKASPVVRFLLLFFGAAAVRRGGSRLDKCMRASRGDGARVVRAAPIVRVDATGFIAKPKGAKR